MNAWTVLALAGAFYAMYRGLSWNSAYYLQEHLRVNADIAADARACELEGLQYIEWQPRGWYEVTPQGAQAGSAEIAAYEQRLRALYAKVQHELKVHPSLWRFRLKDRAVFNSNVRQWVVIRNNCVSITLVLNEYRETSRTEN